MNVETDLTALQEMTTDELRERYAEVFGDEPRSRHKTYLIRRIAWRIQAEAEGDLSERARRRAAELAVDSEVRTTPPRTQCDPAQKGARTSRKIDVPRDPRLPSPGTAITRRYKGRTLLVRVQHDGFEYEGERYKTLSAVAKVITGSHCNGYRFFKLAVEK